MDNTKKNPNVPNLRLRFDNDWKSDIFMNLVYKRSDKLNPAQLMNKELQCIELDSLSQETGELLATYSAVEQKSIKNLFFENDILYGKLRPYLRKYYKANFNGCCSSEIWVLNSKIINHDFLYHYIQTNKFNMLANISTGSKMPRADWNIISESELFYPSNEEMKKIGQFLNILEERIKVQSKIIEDIKSLQISIINLYILSRRAHPNDEYYRVNLVDLLNENNEKKGEKDIEICSVSVLKGVINQLEYLGKSYASENTNNYNVVNPNDIIYTKSPTGEFPYGIVKQNKTGRTVAVSPLYGVYRPVSKEIGNLLHHYFISKINTNNYLCNLIQKGAKNTILISNQRFLENSIYIPKNKETIIKISNLLDKIDEKCKYEESILKNIVDQKKYLLNNLFI